MSDKRIFIIQPDPHPARANAIQAVISAEVGQCVTISEETRSQAQNKLLWPLLDLWSKNQKAIVNGEKVTITREAWKCILLASFRKRYGLPQQLALGLDGELVPLGYETHTMGKREFADFLTFVLAETAERGMELPERVDYSEFLGRCA